MLKRLRSRRVLALLLGLVLVSAVAAYALYEAYLDAPGDVSNPDVEFVEETPTPEPEGKKGKKRPPRRTTSISWPRYGLTKNHDRNFQPGYTLKGPFKFRWRVRAPLLVEFPPVLHEDVLYLLAGNGQLRAMTLERGKTIWKKRLGTLSASAPALDGRRVFVTLLEVGGRQRGRVVALRARDGKILWSRGLSARTESSPLVHRGRVYFGAEDGTLYALSARTGRTIWTYRARGPIKSSPTLAHNRLFFGDYAGHVHAVRLRSGRAAWTQPVAVRSLRGGRFYATAAVAWGRVYLGATDGRQYALSARSGALAWARQTGGYVYSSAALASVRGRGPTVFFGSFDGNFYALDARSGRTRWTYRSGQKISGPATVIGDTVYFSDIGKRESFGIDTRSGKRRFHRPFGAYDTAMSDGRHLIMTGHHSVRVFLAANAPPPHKVRQPPRTGLPSSGSGDRARGSRRGRSGSGKRSQRARRATQREQRAAKRRRAALRRCSQRDTRRERSRCRARIRRR